LQVFSFNILKTLIFFFCLTAKQKILRLDKRLPARASEHYQWFLLPRPTKFVGFTLTRWFFKYKIELKKKMKFFLKQFLSFWKKTYPKLIQIIFLLVFLGSVYIICIEAFYVKQIGDAKAFLKLLIILILLVLTPPLLRTLLFYAKKLMSPATIFQKCLISLIFCIFVILVFILVKIF